MIEDKFLYCYRWPFPTFINTHEEYQNQIAATNLRRKRRRRSKLQVFHRKHKRFSYQHQHKIQPTNLTSIIPISYLITTVILFTCLVIAPEPIGGLDSPVKVQRFKQQLGSNSSNVTVFGPKNPDLPIGAQSTQASNSTAQQAIKVDRIRRTNPQQPTSHNNNTHKPDECPSAKLIQSLLPAEYQQQSQNVQRAQCDCVRDLYGWYVTCYAGSASRNLASVALPNQLHPAFRGPQLQRQQQQQAAAAAAAATSSGGVQGAHRRIHRSAARWMGDEDGEAASNRHLAAASSGLARDSSGHHASSATLGEDSLASHEGFGDEPTTDSATAEEANATGDSSTNDSRRQQRKLSGSPRSQSANGETLQGLSAAASNMSLTDDDSFVLSPSSNSFTLLQPQDLDLRATNSSSSRMSEKMTQQANNNNNHQLMFQTVPILFSVKYTRNNIIEIDCDQAAPQYKPAMFQGFNVNEISSFTFNNCQLPNIPFSALLHRAKPGMMGPAANGQPQAGTTGSGGHQQSLKPSRLRHQNLVRRRRQLYESANNRDDPTVAMDEDLMNPAANDHDTMLQNATQQPPSAAQVSPAHLGKSEPRVRSLTVNLNTVVNQRALMSLLAGLDYLEELQLNYMQLNLTNFEPDLEADPTAAPEILTTRQTSSPSVMAPAPSVQQQQLATPSGASVSQPQGVAPATGSGSTTASTTTSTSTTAAPMQILLASSASGSSTQTPVLVLSSARATQAPAQVTVRSQLATTAPQAADQMSPSTTMPTSTTSTSTTTTTARPPTQRPKQQPQQQQPANGPRPVQTTATRPSLASVGAPRGLMFAQSAGQPSAQTTTPTPTSSTPVAGQAQATTGNAAQTAAPSATLATVVNQQQTQFQTQRQTNPTTANLAADRTTVSNQNTRNSQPLNGPPQISVASSQTQTVSYTSQSSQTPNRGSQQQRQQQAPQTTTGHQQMQNTIQSQQTQPAGPSSMTQNSNLVVSTSPTTRLHHSPSGWFQSSPQGSLTTPVNMPPTSTARAQQPTEAMIQLDHSNRDQTTSSMGQPWNTQPPPNPSGSSNQQLNAPANTPYASMLHTNGFGIRTSQSSGPLPVSLNLYNSNSPNMFRPTTATAAATTGGQTNTITSSYGGLRGLNTNQFTQPVTTTSSVSISRRQTQPTTTSNSNNNNPPTDGSVQFVAPGGRLQMSQNPHRQQPQTTTSATTLAANNQRLSASNNISPATATTSDQDLMSFESGAGSGGSSTGGGSASSAFLDELETPAQPTATEPGLRIYGRRNKRSTGEPMEEFELSFGELLPNLRYLRLQSFIDLSKAAKQSQAVDRKPAHSSSSTTSRPSNANRRFRRQFQPDDLPERDEGHMSDSESEAIAGSGAAPDSLVADESSVHHNSVMASSAELANPLARSGIMETPSRGKNSSADHLQAAGESEALPQSGLDHHLADLGGEESEQQQQQFHRAKRFSQVLVRMFSKLGKLRHLHLDRNDIPYWPDNVLFDSRHSLKRLYLLSNNIRQLGRSSLANLTELETLDLSLNQLRQLSGDMFRDSSGLRNLRACCNLFRKLPSRLFGQIPYRSGAASSSDSSGGQDASHANSNNNNNSNNVNRANRLERLDFSKNPHLSQLSADLFAAGPQQPPAPVKSLTLSNCALTDQLAGKSPKALFASLPDLVSVTLRGNRLRELLATNGLFAKNSRLQALNVSHNQLATLSANLFNTNASQLVELQLDHNHLAQVPEQFLFNLRKLRKLSLAHNRLTHLGAFLFINNEQIELIDLSHNQLVTLNTQVSQMMPFGTGQKLRQLNLAHNNLSQFKADIFDINWIFYTHLNLLDLSSNKFEGQISMPIFHTIADEMLLNLASNSIQSVSVDDLKQHDEHPLDRYATNTAESIMDPASGVDSSPRQSSGGAAQTTKVPTVNIRLTGNPIACDCLLEPLISYSRRVAAAINPTLEAHLFASQRPSRQDGSLEASSRYAVLDLAGSGSGQSSALAAAGERNSDTINEAPAAPSAAESARQPTVFYQFKFNDLYCAKPNNLQRQLLSHVSISDLLCPIRDQRLCPKQCKCDYQSAFKTAFVDCDNQQLSQIPEQLTDASNFIQFNIEPSFAAAASVANLTILPIASVDKVVIYLRNNRLRSMDQLAKLFTVTANKISNNNIDQQQPAERNRFARAPARGSPSAAEEPGQVAGASGSPAEPLASVSAQPLTSGAPKNRQQLAKKVVSSPVMIGRSMQGTSGRQVGARYRRQADGDSGAPSNGETADGFDTPLGNHLTLESVPTTTASSLDAVGPISTAVLESAEEFRNKRYPMTCELHLDHNLIESIPESFLDKLDQWRSSAIHSTSTAPQGALPSMMQEPPIHTKLHHVAAADHGAVMASSTSSAAEAADNGNLVSDGFSGSDGPDGGDHLFGRPPFTPERKAALMESINQKVRLNQLQRGHQGSANEPDHQQSPTTKVSVSPALVVLSLRFNNLAKIEAKMLHRLSKLIMSSNTKFYFGHNPFNCTDNYATPTGADADQPAGQESRATAQRPALLPASPMGDQLMAASDASSGAYLESMADDDDDLAPSASDTSVAAGQWLAPADCPVGQLKSWLTRHRANVDDLDEIYCVRMTPELVDRLKLASANGSLAAVTQHQTGAAAGRLLDVADQSSPATPWTLGHNGSRILEKGGLSWNSELLASSARLVDVNVYDLCPYSGVQVLDPSASGLLSAGHQQAIVSLAIVFILISLCLLLMLIYFGDTQTILAFVYIHMNPIYSCLRLNESHLDGEKLYDAFVSYSSADRDIVMELIERLEQQPELLAGADKLLDFKSDSIVGGQQQVVTNTNGAIGSPPPPANPNGGSSTLSRRTNSFQDLSTMSRSTSRVMMGADEFGGSTMEMSPGRRAHTNSSSAGSSLARDHQATKSAGQPYRLCIHERDWLPGHLISWNIVNSVQNSRRTILILSKDFIKSVWFQVEFHTAYYQMLEDKIDRLIVIVRGELPPKAELDKNLAFLLTTKTYLTWGEKWFWERLHYALPHRSTPPAIRPASTPNRPPKPTSPLPKHYHQAPAAGGKHQLAAAVSPKPSGDLTALAGSGRQRPLVMSSIGKDCSNLLLPVHHQAQTGSSGSSSGSSASNGRLSGSFLSANSSGNLLSPSGTSQAASSPTQTTTNDLLSAAPTNSASATRLTIGPPKLEHQSSHGNSQDSGRLTGHLSSSGPLTLGPLSPRPEPGDASPGAGGVTSILVDGPGIHPAAGGPNSRVRAKRQEKLQHFVDKTISSHFNLSEL